ncbi:E3 ubiquitin-protein ligase SIAH1-like [Diadema antillarum]|uniref:E3 ubiquitin-protein ligase SIAH1-like n=1 Tax=Diadema antillarum TaxID=105358 RepID=UPI003A87923C
MSRPAANGKARSHTPTTNQDLASLFECPVCFDYVLPPILQCQSGHLVCSNCRPKLNCCPTCRGPLGSIRNLAMEKVAQTVMFPCRYASSGCAATMSYNEKQDHEETCEFRPYSCPCPGASCKWQGSLDQVMPHLTHAHKSITTLQGEDIVFLATDINLPGAVDWVMMQSCFGHHFMLVLEKQEKYDGLQQFFAIVQLIGSRKQAENFAYRSGLFLVMPSEGFKTSISTKKQRLKEDAPTSHSTSKQVRTKSRLRRNRRLARKSTYRDPVVRVGLPREGHAHLQTEWVDVRARMDWEVNVVDTPQVLESDEMEWERVDASNMEWETAVAPSMGMEWSSVDVATAEEMLWEEASVGSGGGWLASW